MLIENIDSVLNINENSLNSQTRAHLCLVLAMALVIFCLCPENLSEAISKSNVVTDLQKSFQDSIALR